MVDIAIPGFKDLRLKYLILDYNGTIAGHGELLAGVRKKWRCWSSIWRFTF